MGYLSDEAKARFDRSRRRAFVPAWFSSTWTVGLGVLVLFLFVALLLPHHRTKVTFPAVTSADGSLPVGTAAPSETPAAPQPTGSVTVARSSGGTVRLPAAALQVATAAARALFTGDYRGVPLPDGVQPPPVAGAQTFPHPVVTAPRAMTVTDTQVAISFLVDPDGRGGQPARRTLSLTVVSTVAGWVFQPE